MFTLVEEDICAFDIRHAQRFVSFWSRFASGQVKTVDTHQPIDYFQELNLGRDLTEENVCRLLRWKDPRHLTRRTLSGPQANKDNPSVVRVLRRMQLYNNFRNAKIGEEEMRDSVSCIFSTGIVFRTFLLHIALPHRYPMADQHVLRAYRLHTRNRTDESWETYARYRAYFAQIAEVLRVPMCARSIRKLKRIDDALMAFGRFVGTYSPERDTPNKPSEPTP